MTPPNTEVHRVLVVEDSATMRAVCIDKLIQRGLECDPAVSAESAWDLLEQSLECRPYSAILLDWVLPSMSGESLLRKIKADRRFSSIAIMIFTERPDEAAWELVVARPHTDIQLKDELNLLPQRMEKFIATVEQKTVVTAPKEVDAAAIEERRNECILLVDDSATVRVRYSSLLREAGYCVVEASGYNDALKLAHQESPVLAIIDFYMPDGNGDELCKALNSDQSVDFAMVMFSQRKEVTEIALEVGALDLLFKDDPAHLFLMRINAIMQVIRSKRVVLQLDLLVWATQAFGFGILRRRGKELTAENPIMKCLEKDVGTLQLFEAEASFECPLKIQDQRGNTRYFVVQHHQYSAQEEIIVTQDITLMKQAEKDIQLAKEVAETANQAKSDFLSNMTHELRSPLNSIIVLSKMLAEKKNENMSPRQIESAQIINRSGDDLLTLIDDILDLAKVEAGKISIEVRPFELRNTLKLLSGQLTPLTDAKGLTLTTTVENSIPVTIQTDETRLGQIIRNLVSNAVKFTQEGKVDIDVKMLNSETLRLSVSDTGMGIKPENLQIIFEAFQQEDNSTSRRFGGTGLGLNISRNMIRLLGGRIHVESTLGSGSCFAIDFPMHLKVPSPNFATPLDAPVADAPVPFPAVDGRAVMHSRPAVHSTQERSNSIAKPTLDTINNNQQLCKKTILLVEDDARNVFTMMSALEQFDFDFVIAQHGQEAIDKLKANANPDIVLMDMMMPVMDGFEAIKQIREDELWSDIPIIAVTANDKNNEEERCKGLGANDFIAKPINIDILIEKMKTVLSN